MIFKTFTQDELVAWENENFTGLEVTGKMGSDDKFISYRGSDKKSRGIAIKFSARLRFWSDTALLGNPPSYNMVFYPFTSDDEESLHLRRIIKLCRQIVKLDGSLRFIKFVDDNGEPIPLEKLHFGVKLDADLNGTLRSEVIGIDIDTNVQTIYSDPRNGKKITKAELSAAIGREAHFEGEIKLYIWGSKDIKPRVYLKTRGAIIFHTAVIDNGPTLDVMLKDKGIERRSDISTYVPSPTEEVQTDEQKHVEEVLGGVSS